MPSRVKFVVVLSVVLVFCLPASFGAPPKLALPSTQPGPARPWHAQVQVSTYSAVNTFNGNMITALPLFSWSGRGPDMDMALYHNSANWNQTDEDSRNVGFFLGPGWSISYSDQILDGVPVVHVHANGTRDSYTWDGSNYVPQPGVFNQLTNSN